MRLEGFTFGLAFSFLCGLLGTASCRLPPPSPKTLPDASDASPEVGAEDPAAAACENERRLGCPEGDPAPNGVTCESAIRSTGRLDYRLACVAEAGTAADLRACCDGGGCVRAECAGR